MLVLKFAILCAALLQPPENSNRLESERIREALQITTEWAGKYHFTTDSLKQSELVSTPVLKWSNPERGSVHGNVFLWVSNKRPLAIGSLFQWFSPFTHMSHEFHSLSEEKLTVQRNGKVVWESPAGVSFQSIPFAPEASSTVNTRQLQMRQIARQLTAKKRERDETDFNELRLLPTPIYHYDSSDNVSGGLFAFVQGTDPELIVWLETGSDKNIKKWNVAFARMNSIEIGVWHGTTEMWHIDQMTWGEVSAHRSPYTSFSSKTSPIE